MGQSEMHYITVKFGRLNCGRYTYNLVNVAILHFIYFITHFKHIIPYKLRYIYSVIETVFSKKLARVMSKTKLSNVINYYGIDGLYDSAQ
jgi:hypothetical protein